MSVPVALTVYPLGATVLRKIRTRRLLAGGPTPSGSTGNLTDLRLAILASHEGTTLQAIIEACAVGEIPAQVVIVISNNRGSGALERARAAGIATGHLSSQTHPDPDALDDAISRALVAHGVDLVVLAGYMKKVVPGRLAPSGDGS